MKNRTEKLSSATELKGNRRADIVRPECRGRKIWVMPYLIGLLFAVLIYLALYGGQQDFFFRAQEMSLFLPTKVFFQQQMSVPGGFIIWLGAWLTQFFYYPGLGILILVLLWTLVYGLSLALFKISPQWALCGLIAPLALMAMVTDLGYWLFHLKSVGYMYSNTLGFLCTLALLWGYRSLPARFRLYWIPVSVAVGYPLIGFYALLAGVYMLIWAVKREKTLAQRLSQPLVALLSIGFVPFIWYYVYTQMNYTYIYGAVLPIYYIDPDVDFSQWVPYFILSLSCLPLLLLSRDNPDEKALKKIPFYIKRKFVYWGIQVVLLIGFYYGVKAFWYNDPNFRAELFMNRAAQAEDWDAVLERAHAEEQEPTRLMVLIKNLALFQEGRAGDEMFHFRDGGAMPNAVFDERMMQVGGKLIYLNYGKLNFCYRWCLEDAVEYGMKIEYLKYMTECALFSGDKALARKYLRTLKQTLFYADWAEEREKLLDSPSLLAQNSKYKAIMDLYGYENRLDGDQNLAEIYLLNVFAHTWNSVPSYQEMSMLCTLVMKDIPLFWPRFFSYAQTHQRIPVHYQEAAMLYCYLERQYNPDTLPIDDGVKQRFQAFQNLIAQHQGQSEESLKPLFQSQFGDTFWFFYFFVRNVKSN